MMTPNSLNPLPAPAATRRDVTAPLAEARDSGIPTKAPHPAGGPSDTA